ncbi:MAG: hypothetical protein JWR76_2852, partial [Mucilaginibacter sp.]|nr:hypothetical protein [Mucilaginibacter sp.]
MVSFKHLSRKISKLQVKFILINCLVIRKTLLYLYCP